MEDNSENLTSRLTHVNHNTKHIFGGMVAIALSFVLCTLIISIAVVKVKRAGDSISVVGSAKRPIVSDYIIWRGSVSSRQPTMQAGYRELKKYADAVQKYFSEQEIPDSIITFGSVSSYPIMERNDNGRETGRVLAYNLSQNFDIRSDDVDRIADLSRNITELINDGIPLRSFPPEYIYTKLAEARVELLAEATKDAKNRADMIARAAGREAGVIKSAKMGVFQVTSRNSTSVSDYGMYDTSTLLKDVTAVVRVNFAVE